MAARAEVAVAVAWAAVAWEALMAMASKAVVG